MSLVGKLIFSEYCECLENIFDIFEAPEGQNLRKRVPSVPIPEEHTSQIAGIKPHQRNKCKSVKCAKYKRTVAKKLCGVRLSSPSVRQINSVICWNRWKSSREYRNLSIKSLNSK